MSARVLITSEVRGDTRRYRALHLYEQFRLAGAQVEFIHISDPHFIAAAEKPWDLVIFHRVIYREYIDGLLEKLARKSHPLLCSDFDDLIFDPSVFEFINSPDFSDPIRSSLYLENMRNIRKMLQLSEAAIASTDFLAREILTLGKPVWVHRNAFSFEMQALADLARRSAAKERSIDVVMGYASGTPTHNQDFEMIKPTIKEVMRRFPTSRLHLIGPIDAGEDWGDVGDRIHRFPLVPWRKLPGLLVKFDINLAPLRIDNPFAQSKSEIKYMEAGMLGIPTVASPSDSFCYAIRSGENGFLASTETEWFELLSKLVKDTVLRKQIGELARVEIMANYHPEVRATQLGPLCDEMFKQIRGEPLWKPSRPSLAAVRERSQKSQSVKKRIPVRYEKDPSYVQLGLYSLKQAGLVVTLKQVWIYIRRLVAPIFPFN